MKRSMRIDVSILCILSFFYCSGGWLKAESLTGTGKVIGTVTIAGTGFGAHHATVLLVPLGRTTVTDESGRYSIEGLLPGHYDLIVHMHALSDERKSIFLEENQTVTVDFDLQLSPLRQELTVTASGKEATVFDSLQSVVTLDSIQLKEKNAFGLGEVLENQLGIAKRSFGPGSSRPVIRGFDGDRVLILQDGLPSGTLSSQSGEHGEPTDAADLERIEVVKGPATLLYGSNAIGGVVNSVTEHHMFHEHPHEGLRGHVSFGGGTNNNQAGLHTGFEYGWKNWMVWGTGGRQVAGDYWSAVGRVDNSKTRLSSASFGVGWFGDRPFVNLTYSANRGRFGVPFAGTFHEHGAEEEKQHRPDDLQSLFGRRNERRGDPEEEHEEIMVDETFVWQSVRCNGGWHDLPHFLEKIRLSAAYTRWMHKELENGDEVATTFDNRAVQFRGVLDQRKIGPWNGSLGFQAMTRDYRAEGEEALSPPIDQKGFAVFGLQELDFDKIKFQFGGRLDHTRYDPEERQGRTFTGFSGAAGLRLSLWNAGALVANYNRAFRAPALEELYNYGPHVGNMAFEIGNSSLKRESGDGLDVSLRHDADRLYGEWNFFYYRLGDFVYMAPNGEQHHGLQVVNFFQEGVRFLGSEVRMDLRLHPVLWLNTGLDTVRAHLVEKDVPLPRIPPLRARLGFDFRYRGFSVRPELLLAGAQNRLFYHETRTSGYGLANLNVSYTIPGRHATQILSLSSFNLSDRLYRNHCSFLKDLAPEMGRGLRLNYSIHFY